MITVKYNDKDFVFDSEIHITEFLESQKIQGNNIAIAVNGVVVPKMKWNEVLLKDNDKILIIQASYGG